MSCRDIDSNVKDRLQSVKSNDPRSKYALGWIPDTPDFRDHYYTIPGPVIEKGLPKFVDLRDKCPTEVYNQGQLGSCFPGDTMVTMADLNEKQIKDIEQGEYVSNQDGRSRKVIRKYQRNYTGELYRLKVKGLGISIYATDEHPIAIKYNVNTGRKGQVMLQETIQYVQVKDIDLSKKPFMVLPKTITEDPSSYIVDVRNLLEDELVYNEEKQTVRTLGAKDNLAIPVKFELSADLMRVIGLFLAEGSYRKDNNYNLQGIDFTFNRDEQDYVNFVKETIFTTFGIIPQIKNSDSRPSVTGISISNTTLARIFRKLCGEYSFGKELSPILYKQSRENKLQLIRGWMDGDGVNKTNLRYKNIEGEDIRPCQVTGYTISQRLARDLFRLALTCDLKPSFTIKDNSKYNKTETYNIYFFGKDALELYPEFSDVLFNKGVNIGGVCCYRKDDKHFYCKIESIEKKYHENMPVYNLEVEKDNVYIANFCLVHNCTANAIAGAIEFDRLKQGLPDWTPSRLFIYYNERDMEGTINSDAGAMIRDGIKSVNSLGAPSEVSWPYDITKFTMKPPFTAYDEGKKHLALSYKRINNDLVTMKGCLASGYPFVFGFSVYDSMMSADVAATGILNMPQPSEKLLGGHAVLACGFDDSTQRFTVRNSWGKEWGNNGYFTMPYDYLTDPNLCDDRWSLRLVE